jgi:hypothetical protein
MALTVFKSTDPSAPVLSGTVGSLVALLDACLVNGYGSKAALGWGRPFSATNSAVYRAASGNQHYLQVADNGTDTNGARMANGIGFETMSAYNTGTGLFPTAAQLANGNFWLKSQTLDAVARAWTLIGDAKTFYLFANANGAGFNWNPYGFGEFTSYKSADAYNTFICAGAGSSPNFVVTGLASPQTIGTAAAITAGFYAARSYTQIGTSQALNSLSPLNTTACLGSTGIIYPNAADSGLYLAPLMIAEALTGGPVRGRFRGAFVPMHAMPLATYDQVPNPVGLSGTTVMAQQVSNSTLLGMLFFDITGPW